MIIFVDLKHERLYEAEKTPVSAAGIDETTMLRWSAATLMIKYRLERISEESCLIVRYDQFSLGLMEQVRPSAVVAGGTFGPFENYDEADFSGLVALFRKPPCPVLGVCGAHQLIAREYGGEIGPMNQRELGVTRITLHQPHPLIEGLGEQADFMEHHNWEVKSLSEGFISLGDSGISPHQVIAHQEIPLFGVQFHPERYALGYPGGEILLRNFFRYI